MTESDSELTEASATVSKSQVKRELDALRKLGVQLVSMPRTQTDKLPLSERISEAIASARGFKRKALKRQLGLIGGLMRDEDSDAILEGIRKLTEPQRQAVTAMHEVEQWRDRLLAGETDLVDELAGRYTSLDRQYVSQLLRNAKKETQNNKPPKSARVLYKYLHELHLGVNT